MRRNEARRVRKDDRFTLERVARREHGAAPHPYALRHLLDHRVHIARMVEMLVRKGDCVELERLAWRQRRERAHERAGAGIDVNLRRLPATLVAETEPHSAGRSDLPGDHESGSAGPKKTH